MDKIKQYFPNLSEKKLKQFEMLLPLYAEWNEKINVVSRKDIDNLYLHHVLHSLAIAKFIQFKDGTEILDLGTGGGFPGIPLAILFPEVSFTLVDSIGKKIKVVQEVAAAIGLENVSAHHARAELMVPKYDFVVTRAVAVLDTLKIWSLPLLKRKQINSIPNGLIALKGGNIKEEIKAMTRKEYVEVVKITDYFKNEFYEEKFVVYLQG
jgi:16S rRNA (guanine527-N7)-methyltransferase